MGVSNSFYGSKLFLNDELPEVAAYIERMNAANVELTQVVSQMSGSMVLSVADDLLQTPRMTIEELIESTQKCYGSVLAWACEFDTDAGSMSLSLIYFIHQQTSQSERGLLMLTKAML
ncbi:unnamed protein product [Trifolium pratense]|uniref:Uncharacterized protein n=1 Tax=Trifolium pratense TaxID=57577 RepID=A0ACB0K7C9_TRIPR|nr:unnamed protein product [Trifolium pratense]